MTQICLRRLGSALLALALCASLAVLPACGRTPLPRPPAPQTLGIREHFEPAPVFGGTVHVLEAGPDSAAPLVLIHGFGAHAARDFDPLVPRLSERRHLFMFDLPGFGRSTREQQLYTPARYVRFIHELLRRHFSQPVDILGHSMGGTLALAIAGRYPKHVGRLLLLDVAGVLYYRDYLLNVVDSDNDDAEQRGMLAALWSDARETLLRAALSVTSLEELRLEHLDRLPSYLSPNAAASLMFIGHDFSRELHRISAPTWIGWGADDKVAPLRTAQLLRFMLKPAASEIFAESGHVPMKTEPELLAQSLLEFLDRRVVAPEGAELTDLSDTQRIGSCIDQRDRLFEGDYDSIVIHGCKRVLLRNVRARSLIVESSQVELQQVEVVGGSTGASFSHARVQWTGGRITAPICIDTDASRLDLAGVTCTASQTSLRVHDPGRLIASVSWFEDLFGVRTFHGKYKLARTVAADIPTLSETELARRQTHPPQSTPRFDVETWSGRRLAGEDLSGAALAGLHFERSNLSGADLSAADLRGAHLHRSRLSHAKLTGADLRRADISDAHAERCDLRLADLREADLSESNLSDADLRGAQLDNASLQGARLSGAIYDSKTRFPTGFDPDRRGLLLRAAPQHSFENLGSAHSFP